MFIFRVKSRKTHKAYSGRFYAAKNHGACEEEEAWFVIIDTDHGSGYCDFEKNLALPAFFYSNGFDEVNVNGM